MDKLDRLHDLLREAELHLLEAGQTDAAAEVDDAAFAHARRLGQFSHRHADDRLGLLENELGDSLCALGHSRLRDSNPAQSVFDRTIVDGRGAIPAVTRHSGSFLMIRGKRSEAFRLAVSFNLRVQQL